MQPSNEFISQQPITTQSSELNNYIQTPQKPKQNNNINLTQPIKLIQKPLNAKHRAFINLSYTTKRKWSFDYTLQYIGEKRIPTTKYNPANLQFAATSPSFFTMNAHINKAFKKGFETYAGIENMLNYMQQTTIIDGSNPFGQYFDGSLIWGPTMGRNFYVGLRYKK